jgi:hypothetical protein
MLADLSGEGVYLVPCYADDLDPKVSELVFFWVHHLLRKRKGVIVLDFKECRMMHGRKREISGKKFSKCDNSNLFYTCWMRR